MAKKTAEQLQEEIHARAAIVKKAYEDWKASNANNPYAMYTLEEQKKYLPKGFKNPKDYAFVGGWQKAKELGLDAYDQYGNIITRESMVPSWMGDAIDSGQYVAPNVMAAAMGRPAEEVNRILQDQSYHDAWIAAGKPQGAALENWRSTLSILDPATFTYSPIGGGPSTGSGFGSLLGIFKNLIKPYTPPTATNPPATITPSATTPATGTTTDAGNVAEAAKNLANAKQPTVPNFIQPYQNVNRGFKQAFGEKDINW